MKRHVTEIGDDGRIVTYAVTKAMRKSAARPIPWTRGPRTPAQKLARALWG